MSVRTIISGIETEGIIESEFDVGCDDFTRERIAACRGLEAWVADARTSQILMKELAEAYESAYREIRQTKRMRIADSHPRYWSSR
jgi:hypothetical protein